MAKMVMVGHKTLATNLYGEYAMKNIKNIKIYIYISGHPKILQSKSNSEI